LRSRLGLGSARARACSGWRLADHTKKDAIGAGAYAPRKWIGEVGQSNDVRVPRLNSAAAWRLRWSHRVNAELRTPLTVSSGLLRYLRFLGVKKSTQQDNEDNEALKAKG